jgi:hypothetical protein
MEIHMAPTSLQKLIPKKRCGVNDICSWVNLVRYLNISVFPVLKVIAEVFSFGKFDVCKYWLIFLTVEAIILSNVNKFMN